MFDLLTIRITNRTMSLFKLLSSLPRPILHNNCQGCNGCKWSCDHIISEATIRSLYPSSSTFIRNDPHNIFIICTSHNKRKADQDILVSTLCKALTDEGKGVISRAILYMDYQYGIRTIDHSIMKLWHLSCFLLFYHNLHMFFFHLKKEYIIHFNFCHKLLRILLYLIVLIFLY